MAEDITQESEAVGEPQPPIGAPTDFHARRCVLERRMQTPWITFCRHIALGESRAEAYRLAYPVQATGSQDDTIYSNAQRLFARPVVREYIELLTGAAFERAMIDIEGIYRRLEEIALTEDREKALGPAVRAAEILIDRARGAVPKDVRKEVSGPGGKPVEIRHSGGLSESKVEEVKRKLFGLPDEAPKGDNDGKDG